MAELWASEREVYVPDVLPEACRVPQMSTVSAYPALRAADALLKIRRAGGGAGCPCGSVLVSAHEETEGVCWAEAGAPLLVDPGAA
eukprot:131885-Pleurochrysis_carterae.AAC.1